MPEKLMDLVRLALPLSAQKRSFIAGLDRYLDRKDIAEIRSLVKQKKADVVIESPKLSPIIGESVSYPLIKCQGSDSRIMPYILRLNDTIADKAYQAAFTRFCGHAKDSVYRLVAPNIVGMETVKKAVALQLFATADEPLHILLLGDPGTGKTDILRSAADLSSISSLGLGSGTTGVGLTVTVKGDEVQKGLLPLADGGLCAIDELNLMEDKDRASLYNAMEKGFITYDKGGNHFRFDARIKVIATANPTGDRFTAWSLETLKKQLPFDSALLTRFHLVFLIRKPDMKDFMQISQKIVKDEKTVKNPADYEFVKRYAARAAGQKVDIPAELEKRIVDFVAGLKRDEHRYLVEVSPRLVIGIVRLAKACARIRLSSTVDADDIKAVEEIVTYGLTFDRYK
jgi:DNA replicative helicase MCM subunit Mcm2 (Cdc46/Mcm family)